MCLFQSGIAMDLRFSRGDARFGERSRASLFELRAGLANWCNLSLLWTVLSFCDLYSLFKRKRLGKKSRFFLELNEMPNKNGRFATGFVRHFSILMHGRRLWPNAVLLNKFSQALSQIYRQTILGYFHHGKRLSCILKKGSILNGVDDDFSTPFFVFTKDLRNAIKWNYTNTAESIIPTFVSV